MFQAYMETPQTNPIFYKLPIPINALINANQNQFPKLFPPIFITLVRQKHFALPSIFFIVHVCVLKKRAPLRTSTLPIRILIRILVHVTSRRDGGIGM